MCVREREREKDSECMCERDEKRKKRSADVLIKPPIKRLIREPFICSSKLSEDKNEKGGWRKKV